MRLLFTGPLWVSVGTACWMILMALLGWRDANTQKVNLLLAVLMFIWPFALFAFGYVGWAEALAGVLVFVALAVLAGFGTVGWGDVLVVPAAVALLGVLGLVAMCAGLFVALMHALMDRRESVPIGNTQVVSGIEDWQIPMVAYVSLPVVLVGVVATLMVALN